ncbi:uncharacterized protein LOC118237144 [Anguilla anguilla]|uniref:uncharacterized protein LOC118237144 n=1 Tax=Anguilla anguilla TaxID=7936 RepID=UPI0015A79D8A|nr:uncharacterized protein LOC118237144 [Anguilla anguilla]
MTDKGRRSSLTAAETLALIKAKVKLDHLFSGKRNAARSGWEQVVKDMGLEGQVTARQASKQWDNLKTKYKELKNPPTSTGTDSDEATAATWPWFDAMHEAFGERLSIQPPTLIPSCSVPNHGQTAAETLSSGCEEPSQMSLLPGTDSEEESMPSTCSEPPTKRPKRGGAMLAFLKKQAEKKEARDAALYNQNEQFLALFAELVKKIKETYMESCCVN